MPHTVSTEPAADAAADRALEALLNLLQQRGYAFVPPTPLTHERIWRRPGRELARSVTDIFGWNLPFSADAAGAELMDLLHRADALEPHDAGYRSRVRVASLEGRLYLHSRFPTVEEDAVFFGPDTYRFARFLLAHKPAGRAGLRCVDVGCGSGAGGLTAARAVPGSHWTFTDVTEKALRFTRINARHAGVQAEIVKRDGLRDTDDAFDWIVMNPPYIADDGDRAYRDGGGEHGEGLSIRLVQEALPRLAPGGRLLLYTGVAIIDGADPLQEALRPLLSGGRYRWHYEELDPDVFGEELEKPAYAKADRIAVVGLRLDRL